MPKTIKNKIMEWREFLLLLLAIFNIVGIALAAYITIRLAPLSQNIAILTTEIKANTDTDSREHANFVERSEFNLVVESINHISSRVDQIFNLVK